MQTIRMLLNMKHNGLSDQQVADALKIAKGSVNAFHNRYKSALYGFPIPDDITDAMLRNIVYPPKPDKPQPLVPDWSEIEADLVRPGVTLQLLWEEYHKSNPSGLGRSAFYDSFKSYRKDMSLSMVIIHKGGEKVFVDYSGDGLSYVDRASGEMKPLQVFVAAWGASGYAFVDVTHTQSQEDWSQSHVRALEFYGVAPRILVPDNLKAGVLKPDHYEPTLNPVYARMADHYGISILPARVRRPKDKATVESCVLQVQRRVLAPLRDQMFFSIDDVREAVAEQLAEFNERPMKDHGGKSRQERFEVLDKPYAQPLTQERFNICAIKYGILVQKNYHIEYDHHHYSVPHTLVGKRVDVHQVNNTIEIYLDGEHVCRHTKRSLKYGYETNREHMPMNHAHANGLNPAWLILKGGEVGPNTSSVVKRLLENRKHPEQGFKSAQGITGLARKYGVERLEAACARALHYDCCEYRAVKSILEGGLDMEPLPLANEDENNVVVHANVRGPSYYSPVTAQGGI